MCVRPQELNLEAIKKLKNFNFITIFRIFNMTPDRIQERHDFLIGFLDLPKKWRLVNNLSGGQQRSVNVV